MSVGTIRDALHGITVHRCDDCSILIDPRSDEPHEAVKDGQDIVVCDAHYQDYTACKGCGDHVPRGELDATGKCSTCSDDTEDAGAFMYEMCLDGRRAV